MKIHPKLRDLIMNRI